MCPVLKLALADADPGRVCRGAPSNWPEFSKIFQLGVSFREFGHEFVSARDLSLELLGRQRVSFRSLMARLCLALDTCTLRRPIYSGFSRGFFTAW